MISEYTQSLSPSPLDHTETQVVKLLTTLLLIIDEWPQRFTEDVQCLE